MKICFRSQSAHTSVKDYGQNDNQNDIHDESSLICSVERPRDNEGDNYDSKKQSNKKHFFSFLLSCLRTMVEFGHFSRIACQPIFIAKGVPNFEFSVVFLKKS